jgi:hypothetical protein
MKKEQLHALLYEALETEMGGVEIYETAVSLAQRDVKTAIGARARSRRGPRYSRAA